MRTTTFIYTLSCPKSGDVRYVGKSNNPRVRFTKHMQMTDNNKHKNSWIKGLRSDGSMPVLTIVEEVLISEWQNKEKSYISKFRELGCELFNTSIGGEGLDYGNQTSFKPGNGNKKVVCLLSDGTYHMTFESGKYSAKYIGKHNISSALKGVTKKAGGYIWIYEDKYNQMSENELIEFVENANYNKSKDNCNSGSFKNGHNTWNKKEIHQYTIDNVFIKTWDNSTSASIFLKKINSSGITRCARGERNTSFGYKWSYIKI